VNRLYVACAIFVPLFGCTGIASNGSDPFAAEAGASAGGAGNNGTGGAASSGNVGNNAGSGASASSGAGGVTATGGLSATGGSSNGGTCFAEVLPKGVQQMLTTECASCHGTTPLAGLPALVTYANLTAPSNSDATKTNAALALARIQSTTSPMPPAPGTRASASDIAALQDFIAQGYPKASCPTTGTGGAASGGSGGAPAMDPLSAMPICTSMTSWNRGNNGSASMNPGTACIACHKSTGGEAPSFSIAGTVYPTGHEPDLCNSKAGTDGARIVIIGADGQMLTLTPNSVGNFSAQAQVKTPYQAKVTYQGRERLMASAQTSGDCNSCHSQNGTNMAPGRITVP